MVCILGVIGDVDTAKNARVLCIPGIFLSWPKAAALHIE